MNRLQKAGLILRYLTERVIPYYAKFRAASEEATRVSQENATLRQENEALRQQIAIDDLMGLWTPYVAVKIINDIIAGARREQAKTVNVVLIDLDDFGKVNKRWGWAVGNLLLATTGITLTDTIRPTDKALRIGGEELLVVSSDQKPGSSMALAERIRKAVAANVFNLPPNTKLQDIWPLSAESKMPARAILPDGTEIQKGVVLPQEMTLPVDTVFPDGLEIRITASLGITRIPLDKCPQDIGTFDPKEPNSFIGKVIESADKGLRTAKNSGKDRCCKGSTPDFLKESPEVPVERRGAGARDVVAP